MDFQSFCQGMLVGGVVVNIVWLAVTWKRSKNSKISQL